MSTRCTACNVALLDNLVGYKREIELEDGGFLEIEEDLCNKCRTASTLKINILEKEYQFDNLSDGLTPSTGFSDETMQEIVYEQYK